MDYQYSETADVLGRGGAAIVYRATHAESSDVVALKRPLPFEHTNERLKREIDVLSKIGHRHVVPVLDHGVDDEGQYWYTMPVARGSLRTLGESGRLRDADALAAEVVDHVGLGLKAMHDVGYLHRDVNPNNILALDDPDGGGYRWVVADCGLVRRPLGETTHELTGSASRLGTDGYIAPEAFGEPHEVTEAADIYSLGRVLGWLLTGETPVLTRPLLPEGPWRPVVRAFTFDDPLRRPQTMAEAMSEALRLRSEPPTSEKASFRRVLAEQGGRLKPDDPLWDVALENLGDFGFMIDEVARIKDSDIRRYAAANPDAASKLGEQMAVLLMQDQNWGRRNFDSANRNLDWLHSLLEGLVDADRLDLLEDVGVDYCRAVEHWNRYPHDDVVRRWLTNLRGRPADAMARAIHQSGVTDYFKRVTEGRSFASPSLEGLLKQ